MDIPPSVRDVRIHLTDQVDDVNHVWELWRRAYGTIRWRITLLDAIRKRVGLVQPQEFEGFRAQPLIARAHAAVAIAAAAEAALISRRRWLHLLRRLPSNWTPDRTGYLIALFEAFTGLEGSTDEPDFLGDRFHVAASDGQPLARLAIAVGYMADLHLAYRRAGRGQRIAISTSGWPQVQPDASLESAILAYDSRLRTFQQNCKHLPQVGTVCIENRAESYDPATTAIGILVCQNPEWRVNADRVNPAVGHASFSLFVPTLLSFSPLRRLLSADVNAAQLNIRDAATCIAFLAVCGPLLAGDENDRSHCLSLGFCQIASRGLKPFFETRFFLAEELLSNLGLEQAGPQSAMDLISRAAAIHPKLWPVRRGPLIRHGYSRTILDLHAASERVMSFISAPQGGHAANVRSAHFEEAVQNVIDGSQWRADSSTRSLRGRHLRVDGPPLGEIDAIGRNNDTLLVVSCKGKTFGTALEKGEARSVRNSQAFIVNASAELHALCRQLETSRRGSNFDLSWVRSIESCVCVPQPLFVSSATAHTLKRVGNARVVGLNELDSWLQSSHGAS